MSLVVAMQIADNDVVLAADRRGTYGDPRGLVGVDENLAKLHRYGTHAALGIVGMPGAVLDPLRLAQTNAGSGDPILSLSESLRGHYAKNFGLRPFIAPTQVLDQRPSATILYADRRPGAVGLCTMSSELNFAPVPAAQSYLMAGVATYALYLFQRIWREDFTAVQALRLGAFLITETSRLDPKVGPIADLLHLTKDGPRQLSRQEVDKIVRTNDERLARFADSFKDDDHVAS